MKILVTGASGFLGARLVRLLLLEGHRVRGTFRPGDDLRLLDGMDLELQACDLLDQRRTRQAASGMDAVMHVAALVSFDPALYWQQLRVNVEGTALLLRACQEAGVKRLVFTSTVNTLGAPPPGTTGDEQTPFDWGPWRLGYMDSKRGAEQLVLGAAAQGLHAVCVLPGTFFGPGDINVNAGQYIVQCARGRLRAAPPGGTSVVHVDDVAQGHLLALQHGERGRRYILGGENLTYRALFSLVATAVGRAPPAVTLPAPLLSGLGRGAGWLRARAGLQLPFSPGLARAACARLFYSSDRARGELGYSFRPAARAIEDAVRWYRRQGLVLKSARRP